MIGAFILGIAVLIAVLLLMRWYVGANPKTLKKGLMWIGLGLGLMVMAWLALTGKLWAAVAALPAAVMWFVRLVTGVQYVQMLKNLFDWGSGWFSPGTSSPSGGQGSHVRTRFVDMYLDHATGHVSGAVLEGRFQGQQLEDMNVEDLIALLAEAQVDPDSARVVESYLDRRDPHWRNRRGEDHSQSHSQSHTHTHEDGPRTASATMTRAEALKVLGLKEGASAAEIKAAHRRLMAQLHPDHGGSDYLAQQINQAKDVLLGD